MKKIFLILICLFVTLPAMAQDSTFDRVMRTGEIRCGYAMWAPVLYKDLETNELSGIFYDLMEEVGKRLSFKINWAEEAGWGSMIEGLMANRYDMICHGVASSSERSKFINFGQTIFYTPLIAVAKKEDMRFDQDYNAINNPDIRIAVLEGEISSITARQSFPKASLIAIPQIVDYSLLLKEVEAGKADLTFVEPSVFGKYAKNNPDILKHIQPSKPISVFPVSVALPLRDVAFNRMINATLRELMNDGTVERLIKKYEEYPGAFLRLSKPYEVPN